jgi:hypothetical protein
MHIHSPQYVTYASAWRTRTVRETTSMPEQNSTGLALAVQQCALRYVLLVHVHSVRSQHNLYQKPAQYYYTKAQQHLSVCSIAVATCTVFMYVKQQLHTWGFQKFIWVGRVSIRLACAVYTAAPLSGVVHIHSTASYNTWVWWHAHYSYCAHCSYCFAR